VYVDRILGLHPVSRTKACLASFAVFDALQPSPALAALPASCVQGP